jgi:hypothetical protein
LYNTIAVGGTNSTATHNCLYHLAEYQSYDIKRARDRLTVVLFLFYVSLCVVFVPFFEKKVPKKLPVKEFFGTSRLVYAPKTA